MACNMQHVTCRLDLSRFQSKIYFNVKNSKGNNHMKFTNRNFVLVLVYRFYVYVLNKTKRSQALKCQHTVFFSSKQFVVCLRFSKSFCTALSVSWRNGILLLLIRSIQLLYEAFIQRIITWSYLSQT